MELAQYSKAAQETVKNLRIIDDAFFRLVTEYDALHNGQVVTRVKRCMQTPEGYDPVNDKEEILFANTAVIDGSAQSELLQLFLRRDIFEDERFPQISKAVKYYKQTEGGRLEMSMTLNDFKEMCVNDFCFNLVNDGSITVEIGAKKLGISVSEFEQKMKEAGYKVPESA